MQNVKSSQPHSQRGAHSLKKKEKGLWVPQCSLGILKQGRCGLQASAHCHYFRQPHSAVPSRNDLCHQSVWLPPNSACLQQAKYHTLLSLIFNMPIPPSFLMFDRPWDKRHTLDTSSEILKLFCTQSLNNFESCHLLSRSLIKSIKKKERPSLFPALHKKNGNRPPQPCMKRKMKPAFKWDCVVSVDTPSISSKEEAD